MFTQIVQQYTARYSYPSVLIQAPGRINIIGEHTDYNEGWVLPAAIDKSIYFALGKNNSPSQFQFYSSQFEEQTQFNIKDSIKERSSWDKYLLAATQVLLEGGYAIQGVSGVLSSDIPVGAGLSSSAALCCGYLYGLSSLFKLGLKRAEIAHLAQATEHRIGLNCGLMDQYASLFGATNNALLLDCQSLKFQHIPLELGKYELYIINSNVKHELAADSGYNERRASCERVVAQVQQQLNPAIKSLRDCSLDMITTITDTLPVEDIHCARYVLDENKRVLAASTALRQRDLKQLGELLYASHEGMRTQYQITIPEIDLLVDLSRANKAILGSRMMGGGFGGCTINIIEKANAKRTLGKITAAYHLETGRTAAVYQVKAGNGVRTIADTTERC